MNNGTGLYYNNLNLTMFFSISTFFFIILRYSALTVTSPAFLACPYFFISFLYFRPPVCEVCPNYEVVLLQPWIVIPLHISSSHLTLYFNISLPSHLFLLLPLDHSFPPLFYRLPIRSCSSPKPSRFTRSPHPLP